ncbi:tubulin-folding cofactor C [Alnus glutinosa]|uniref:tubulin-folding cofactor C n=1 Tax=Alnus glutinosa TaxID=3517 RepID=UPI002D77BCB7|nr:tubulin-folding cofactor C [Alnus glutinosa]
METEEEEERLSLPTSNQTLTDPTLHQKHQSMLARLSNRHQTRVDNSLARRSDSDSNSPSSASAFLSRFSDSKRSIEAHIVQSRLDHPTDPSEVKSHLDSISASISDLEKLVAESSFFLPSYEVRSSLKAVSDLRQSLDNLSSELIPKKKFAFKNKASKRDPATEPKQTTTEEKSDSVSTSHEKLGFQVRDSPGFRDKKGEILVENFKGSEIGEFTVSDLDSCEVKLIGSVRALFVHRLRNCRVYAGPVIGSVLIDEAEGCVFVMASHQIRIHNAKGCDFYLRVRSRPIIEDSSGVRFAPYCLSYEGVEEDLRDASLDEETGNWANVDDFRWLRAVQSPNWSLLPENERVRMVNILDLGGGIEGN